MAVSVPAATLTIAKASALVAPLMAVNPLGVALENGNHNYRHFCPPLASVMPIWSSGLSRDSGWMFAILPSADGLRYEVQHRILPAFTGGTVTVQAWENLGTDPTVGWVSVYGPTATAATTAGVWLTHTHAASFNASARMMRVAYTAAGGNYLPGHILVRPNANPAAVPFVAPFGITASGFRVWDTALLSFVGGPVNTEMVDRCRRNNISILRDRRQNVLSLVQEDGIGGQPRHVAPSASQALTDWVQVGHGVIVVPWQTKFTLDLRVLATVSGGATTSDRVRVAFRDQGAVDFAATGLMVSGSIALQGSGGADSQVVFDVGVRRGDAATTTRLNSVMAFWRPGD